MLKLELFLWLTVNWSVKILWYGFLWKQKPSHGAIKNRSRNLTMVLENTLYFAGIVNKPGCMSHCEIFFFLLFFFFFSVKLNVLTNIWTCYKDMWLQIFPKHLWNNIINLSTFQIHIAIHIQIFWKDLQPHIFMTCLDVSQ